MSKILKKILKSKSKYLFITLLVIIFNTLKVNATHVMGSDIVWKCLGNHRYEVTLKFYRDCQGIAFSGSKTMQFNCVRGGSGSTSINLPRTTWRDITPSCVGVNNPCGTPGNQGFAGEGVEEHLYTNVIDFNSGQLKAMRDAGCCRFRMTFGECCRNGSITTGGANANYSTDAEIDICNIDNSIKKGCDDSPDLRNVPIGYLCCNQPFYFNNGVVDIDGDSLYFSLVASQSAQGTSVNYSSPFNPTTWPMTGYCRSGRGPCACRNRRPIEGICFDPVTGDLAFLPIDCDEVGILVIKVEQFRLDSNANEWLYIGYTKRDLQLQVVNCGDNNPPLLRDLQNPTICEGERICVTIIAEDEEYAGSNGVQPWKDTIDLTWNQGLPGATFEVGDPYFVFNNGITYAMREVEICWQTKLGDGRESPYLFTITARDRACPRNAVSSRGYAIRVKRTAYADRIYAPGDCGRFAMHSIPHDSFWYKGTYQHLWEIRDSTNTGEPVFRSNRRTDSLQFLEGGKYIISYTVDNPPLNCPSVYSDTIVIPELLQAELPTDTFVCEGDTVQVEVKIIAGDPPYRVEWENPLGNLSATDTMETLRITTLEDRYVSATIIDGNNCTASDTIFVKAVMNPRPNIGPDVRICSYDTLFLESNYPPDSMWKFWWSTAPPNRDSAESIWWRWPTKIYHRVIDTLGCWGEDSMELFVNEPVRAIAGSDRGVCIFDTIEIVGQRTPDSFATDFTWSRLTENGKTFITADTAFEQRWNDTTTRTYELFVEVTQEEVTCVDADTFNLTVWPLPVITFEPVEPKCFDYGAINLNSADGPQAKPDWLNFFHRKPGIVTGGPSPAAHFFQTDSFPQGTSPQYGAQGTWVQAEGRDSNNCYNIDSFRVIIFPNPRVELDSSMFCQNAQFPLGATGLGPQSVIPLSRIVRIASTGAERRYRVLKAPSQIPENAYESLIQPFGSTDRAINVGPNGDRSKLGWYTIELCVTNNLTNCRSCDTTAIEVVELPVIEFSFIPNQCVNFDTLNLDNYVNLNNGRWSIKSGPANFEQWLQDSVKFMPFKGPGLFELRYVHTASGCRVADSTQINVSPLPVIRLDTFSLVCSSDPVRELRTLIPPNPGSNGKWSGFGVSNTGNNYFFNPDDSPRENTFEGPHPIRFEYKHPITSCENSSVFDVRIQSHPEIEITSPKPFEQCEFLPFNLVTEQRFAESVTWSHTGDGSYDNVKSLTPVYTHGTEDTVQGGLTVRVETDPFGVCPQVSDEAQLIIHAFPQFDFEADNLSGCQPLDVNFSSLIAKPQNGNLSYLWEFDSVPTRTSVEANPSIIYENAGDYDIRLLVINNNGNCSTEVTKNAYINVYPVPVASFTTSPTFYTTLARPEFRMRNRSRIEFGTMSHFWDFGTDDEDTSHQFEPIFNYGEEDTGSYLIRLWVESDRGCVDSTQQWVEIGPDVTVYIPNVFSPNDFGPESNNRFWVTAQGIIDFNVKVFNRWGEKIYESDQIEEGWDGRFRGVDCQQDVYMYVVNVTGFDGKEYEFSGTVTLLR